MQLNNHDLGNDRIPSLFRAYLLPTLVGMLSICGVTAIDGIFIGHGVGSDGLAAVNIAYAPIMAFTGVGLMLGIGASVVSSIALADGDTRRARLNITGIGYFQSVERNAPSLVFSLLRGAVFIIPVFFAMAHFAGLTGLWLALAVSETMTAVLIIALFAYTRRHSRRTAAHHG